MADLIIPDSRLEMPSLFYPNRKPVGNVQIDWSNPLTDKLAFYVLTGNGNVDLVKGVKPIVTDFNYKEKGGSFHQNGVVDNYVEYDKDDMPDCSNGFTLIFDIVWDHAHNDTPDWRFLIWALGAGDGLRLYHTGLANNPLRFKLAATSIVDLDVDTSDFQVGDKSTIALTWDTATMHIFENGKDLGSIAHTGALDSSTFDNWAFGMSPANTNAGATAATVFKSYSLYQKGLTSKELTQLHNNHYQFLVPA